MVIVVRDSVSRCFSQNDGLVLKSMLDQFITMDQPVTLSFAGIQDVTSSFVNSSLVPFVEQFGGDRVKRLVRITSTTRQIADTIRRCVANAERRAFA